MAQKERLPAYLPLTFGGIARFAFAPPARVWFFASLFACICALVIAWFAGRNITPVVSHAIASLPRGGRIESSSLIWPGEDAIRLAEGAFLSITVEPRGAKPIASSGDFDLIVSSDELRLRSLFGYAGVKYPSGWIWFLDSAELGPKWGAWEFTLLTLLTIGTAFGLVASWFMLALLHALPARLLAFYADRDTTLHDILKLCTVAMIPPGLFMSAALVFYGTMTITLPGMILATMVHFILQPCFVVGAVLSLPKRSDAPVKNPFISDKEGPTEPGTTPEPKRAPFIDVEPD